MKTIVFIAALFAGLSGVSFAESSCLRTGSGNITLTDIADCNAGFASFHPEAGWKFAYVEDDEVNVGCWRTDGVLIHVELDGKTTTGFAANVVDAKACPRPESLIRDELWESEIDECENIDLPEKTTRIACVAAMKLAESFDESDPRFVRTLDGLSFRLEDTAESEALLHRSLAINRKHFSSDYSAQMSSIVNFAYLRTKQGDWEASIPFYQEAIAIGRKHFANTLGLVVNTMLLGKLFLDHGKPAEAKALLLEALAGAEQNNSSYWYMANHVASSCARFLADVYRAEGNLVEAERYVEIERQHLKSPRSNQRESEEVERGDAELS